MAVKVGDLALSTRSGLSASPKAVIPNEGTGYGIEEGLIAPVFEPTAECALGDDPALRLRARQCGCPLIGILVTQVE
jgi:hypothetical protein